MIHRACKAILLALSLCVIGCTSLTGTDGAERASIPSNRQQFNFNPGWKVLAGDASGAEAADFNDAAWKNVTLPHAWNEDSAFKVAIADLPNGIAWYRKHFKLPANSSGKKIFLEFQGVRMGGEFWLNGKQIGLSENGVMAFGLDITDAVKPAPEENVLAAKIDNSWTYRERATNTPIQWNDRNFYANYGGINKNVVLHITDKLYQTLPLYSNLGTTGVYVYGSDYDIPSKSATVHVESQVRNENAEPTTFAYQVRITDPDGRTIKTIDADLPVTIGPGETKTVNAAARLNNLNFWSWGYGYLYDVQTILNVNGKPVDVVNTRTGFRKTEFANGMVKLNDRTIHLKGYAQRTTNEWPAIGINLPPWMSDYSNHLLVEDNGNLVRWMHVTPSKQDVESCDRVGLIQAMPAGDSEGDTTGRRWEMRTEVMRDAIIYNRNNPSILFYESGNKGVNEDHMKQMKAVRDKYDPHGGRASGSREMLASHEAEYGGEMLYVNKSATIPVWMMEYSRDESLRKWWDDYSPPFHRDGTGQGQGAAYNRNQDSQAIENVVRWYEYWTERPGTGRRVNAGGVKIIWADSNTHFRGSETFRRSGAVDAMRLPKDSFYADQVMWDGWVNIEHPRAYIVGHWNYTPQVKKSVYVVSSADKVELFLNGKSLGMGKQSDRFLFTFENIQWEPGELKAVGYDASGRKMCDATKKTVGEPVAIRLTPHTGPKGLRADGADLALVDVEVVDAQGNRCPTALNMIDFSLSGPAEWRGGIAQGPGNYILAKSLPVECGVNRVIVRSGSEAGRILLTASSMNLKPASIELVSRPFKVEDGIATEMPADEMRARLDRGPTPPGDSVTITRTPVRIVRATAGSDSDKAALSFDELETTSWSNSDGAPSNAWIQYELERPANVSEVTLKMGNFQARTYPIRITVDGKPAFSGETRRGLGYVTQSFQPIAGKTVRISLTGSGIDEDAFKMVEVNGTRLPQTATPATNATDPRRGSLSIIEAEIYEPVK